MKLPCSTKHPASKKPAALQGEKGRRDSPEQEADTADTAWGQGSPLPPAKDHCSRGWHLLSCLVLVCQTMCREGFLLPCQPSHRGG